LAGERNSEKYEYVQGRHILTRKKKEKKRRGLIWRNQERKASDHTGQALTTAKNTSYREKGTENSNSTAAKDRARRGKKRTVERSTTPTTREKKERVLIKGIRVSAPLEEGEEETMDRGLGNGGTDSNLNGTGGEKASCGAPWARDTSCRLKEPGIAIF